MARQTATDSVTSLQRSLGPLLWPLGACYGGLMRLRESLYGSGALRSWRPQPICVSVGNIGWGGTGKTPLVSWLLGWAVRRHLRPVVLTRGYRAHPKQFPYPVPPGALAEEAGDEPLMLAREHPSTTIVVDPVRMRGGRWAEANVDPGLFILDDGFQHMAVARDADLVLLRPEDFTTGWNQVIPAGTWRETSAALSRASAFLVKFPPTEFKALAEVIRTRMARFGKPVFSFSIRPLGLRNLTDGSSQPDLGGEPYLLVSGVGDPGQVETTVRRFLGMKPEAHRTFQDHHTYTRAEVAELEAFAEASGCEYIICTPKDAVKLGPMATDRFWTLDLDLAFGPSMGAGKPFDRWWADRYDALYLKRYGQLPALGQTGRLDDLDDLEDPDEVRNGYDHGREDEWDNTLNVSLDWKQRSRKDAEDDKDD